MKNLLFIGLTYHDYTKEMIVELEKLGYNVRFHSIKPRNFFNKVLHSISPTIFQKKLDEYHSAIIEEEKENSYEIVFFLQVHLFSLKNVSEIKSQHSDSKFVLYNWDSVKTHDYRHHIPFFNEVYTFDQDDAKKLNVNYLPLFCIEKFQNIPKLKQEEKRVYFVGNIVSVQRYVAVQKFIKYCSNKNVVFNYFLSCTPVVLSRLLKNGHFPFNISFSSITNSSFLNLITNSTTVFDFANHQQVGYTMRIIENLCAGKKIITNNARVLTENFYSEDRILVVYDLDFSNVDSFVLKELVDPCKTFEEFHLNNFLKKIVN
jgi:hypothetical protein